MSKSVHLRLGANQPVRSVIEAARQTDAHALDRFHAAGGNDALDVPDNFAAGNFRIGGVSMAS